MHNRHSDGHLKLVNNMKKVGMAKLVNVTHKKNQLIIMHIYLMPLFTIIHTITVHDVASSPPDSSQFIYQA